MAPQHFKVLHVSQTHVHKPATNNFQCASKAASSTTGISEFLFMMPVFSKSCLSSCTACRKGNTFGAKSCNLQLFALQCFAEECCRYSPPHPAFASSCCLLSPSFAVSSVAHKVSLGPVVCLISVVKLPHGNRVNGSRHRHAEEGYLEEACAIPLESVLYVLSICTPVLDVLVWLDRQVSDKALLLVQ